LTLNITVDLKYGLEVTQGYSNWYLFAFYSNYGTILYCLRETATYYFKIA